jgi:tRNA pseudouridine38-40 synthase
VRRFKFILEYDGSCFFGWQRQQTLPTVQQLLEDTLSFLVKHPVVVIGAGRTDKGVNATGQTAHADLNYPHNTYRLQAALNYFLPSKGLSVKSCEIVDQSFHARACAIYRCYEYRILNRIAPPVFDKKVWHVFESLDVLAMHEAAQELIGLHDFTSFRDTQCQSKSPIKTISEFQIKRDNETIIANLKAPSFLHHQVRIMIGTLKAVGSGKIDKQKILDILAAKNRSKAGVTAPPQGLTFTHVGY